jgi:hypothetical protein
MQARRVDAAAHKDIGSGWHICEQDAARVTIDVGKEHRILFEERADFGGGKGEDRLDGVGREAIGEFLEHEMPAVPCLILDFDRNPSSVSVALIRVSLLPPQPASGTVVSTAAIVTAMRVPIVTNGAYRGGPLQDNRFEYARDSPATIGSNAKLP